MNPKACVLCNMLGYEPVDYPLWIPNRKDSKGASEDVLAHGTCGEFFESMRPEVDIRKYRYAEAKDAD